MVLTVLAAASVLAQTHNEKAKRGAADFDMAACLAQLSTKGKEAGYKGFVHKQTPQGERRIYFAMPAGWSPNNKRSAVIFFYGGGWSGGNVFSYDEQSEYFAKCGVVDDTRSAGFPQVFGEEMAHRLSPARQVKIGRPR